MGHWPGPPSIRGPRESRDVPRKFFSGECIVSELADNNEQTNHWNGIGNLHRTTHTNWWLELCYPSGIIVSTVSMKSARLGNAGEWCSLGNSWCYVDDIQEWRVRKRSTRKRLLTVLQLTQPCMRARHSDLIHCLDCIDSLETERKRRGYMHSSVSQSTWTWRMSIRNEFI